MVAALAGYWSYAGYERRAQQQALLELVADSTVRLRAALSGPPPADALARIGENLQAARAPRDTAFAEAAQQYLTDAREIVRRRVVAEKLAREAAASRQALGAHMARAAARNERWFQDAVELKKRVEREHFDLGATLKALDGLLYTLPESGQRLASRVPPQSLPEKELIDRARRQAQEDEKRAAAELEQARQLAPR